MTDTAPIVVNATPAAGQTIVAVRQLILTLAPIATTLGATHIGTLLGQIATSLGSLATVVTIVMGQFHERHSSQKLAVLAAALPNSVATVKAPS